MFGKKIELKVYGNQRDLYHIYGLLHVYNVVFLYEPIYEFHNLIRDKRESKFCNYPEQ